MEQHLFLVTLKSGERRTNGRDHLGRCVSRMEVDTKLLLYPLTVQGLTVRALLMKWNCSIPDCRKD